MKQSFQAQSTFFRITLAECIGWIVYRIPPESQPKVRLAARKPELVS